MKIVVYAICKDEKPTIPDWITAVSEADEVIVLDTGSTDGSAEHLKDAGFKVFNDFPGPFRFDHARNHALEHVPADADWCFSVDIDEIFEPGWRAAIEKAAAENPNATQIEYPFVFTHRTDPATGAEIDDQVFYKGNCHRRRGFKWVCPCHEVLVSDLAPVTARAEGCRLHHRSYPKPRRDSYITMLEDGARTDPADPRVHYYLGREYLYRGQYQKAAETLCKYLDLAGQYCWHDEKGNAVLYIAKACQGLGDLDRAESWGLRAIAETAGREPYLFLADLYLKQDRWFECRHYAENALQIPDNHAYFRDPNCYRATPWDYIAASAFQLGDRDRAETAARKCLEYDPANKRYRDNAAYFGISLPSGPAAETAPAAPKEPDSDPRPETELAVAFSITENFAEHLEVTLFSLLKHNRIRDLYIMIPGGKPAPKISALARAGKTRRVHWLDLDKLLEKNLIPDCPNKNPVCTPATLGRLFLSTATKEEKILYLDTDIIVNGPLTELWDTPLDNGAALAGVIDQGALNLWGNYTRTLSYGGIPGYLNAGILLMNLGLIRALSLDRAALDLLNRHRYQFADQDVLNIACKGRTVALDNKWNSGQACGRSAAPVIEHFVCYADFYENPDCAAWQRTKEEYRIFLEKMMAAAPV